MQLLRQAWGRVPVPREVRGSQILLLPRPGAPRPFPWAGSAHPAWAVCVCVTQPSQAQGDHDLPSMTTPSSSSQEAVLLSVPSRGQPLPACWRCCQTWTEPTRSSSCRSKEGLP